MRSATEYLTVELPTRRGFVNITPEVERVVARERRARGPRAGERHAHHGQRLHQRRRARAARTTTTAGSSSSRRTSRCAQYRHNDTGEDNADAHLKRQVMGREVVVAITRGKLDFGPWEQIFYGEFDGRRRKRVLVKVIGD